MDILIKKKPAKGVAKKRAVRKSGVRESAVKKRVVKKHVVKKRVAKKPAAVERLLSRLSVKPRRKTAVKKRRPTAPKLVLPATTYIPQTPIVPTVRAQVAKCKRCHTLMKEVEHLITRAPTIRAQVARAPTVRAPTIRAQVARAPTVGVPAATSISVKAQQRQKLKDFLEEEDFRAGMYLQGQYERRFDIIRDNIDLINLEIRNDVFREGFSEGDVIPVSLAKILLENGVSIKGQGFLEELVDPVTLLYLMVLGYKVGQEDYEAMRASREYPVPREFYDFLDKLKSNNFRYIFTQSDYNAVKRKLQRRAEYEIPAIYNDFLEEMKRKVGTYIQ
jgi:hypothetical protein